MAPRPKYRRNSTFTAKLSPDLSVPNFNHGERPRASLSSKIYRISYVMAVWTWVPPPGQSIGLPRRTSLYKLTTIKVSISHYRSREIVEVVVHLVSKVASTCQQLWPERTKWSLTTYSLVLTPIQAFISLRSTRLRGHSHLMLLFPGLVYISSSPLMLLVTVSMPPPWVSHPGSSHGLWHRTISLPTWILSTLVSTCMAADFINHSPWSQNLTNAASSSCYFSDNGEYVFSAGGPTARIHALDVDGGIGRQVDEMFYVPKEDIANVNKTRAAVVCKTLHLMSFIFCNLQYSLALGCPWFWRQYQQQRFCPTSVSLQQFR